VAATGPSLSSRQGASHHQIRILLWFGFGGLLLLLCGLGLSAISFLYQIEIRQERIRQDYVERDRTLEKLRSSIYLSGTYIRDFLLDTNEALALRHKRQFLETRDQVNSGVAAYRALLGPKERQPFEQLSDELASYFDTLTPTLNWSTKERNDQGYDFVRDEVLPRRMTAINLADRIQQVSEEQLEVSSQAVSDLFASFRSKLMVLLGVTVAIGLILTAGTLWRLLNLENEAELRFQQVLNAREELKQLSAELVSAQESERRRISRELHDEVGQVLSAMMLGLGNLRSSLKESNMKEALVQLSGVEEMTSKNVNVVRNISLLLRPTMLDDLGLVPALKWLAREVSRTGVLQADVFAEDHAEDLPEEHRTCVYRVVQEAVRNASRHSGAHQVRIYVQRADDRLRVSVQDDGKGFDPTLEKGLGILGMEERVVHLGGTLQVDSERGRGAIVSFELPVPNSLDRPASHTDTENQETSPFRTA
jgi:signal transduction histidine kinase